MAKNKLFNQIIMKKSNFADQVTALERLSKDEKGQLQLGKKLIREAARAVYEEKRGMEISNPDLELTLKEGDLIPSQLRDQIPTDPKGRAVTDSLVQYLNLRIWFRIWVRFWLRVIFGARFEMNPLNTFEDFADHLSLAIDEQKLVARLKKIGT